MSPTFVRKCLPLKYKDDKQSSNAKMQVRSRERKQEEIATNNLATLVSPSVINKSLSRPVAIIRRPSEDERLDYMQRTRFAVPKSRLQEIIKALNAANKRCYLYFDGDRELIKIEPDSQMPNALAPSQLQQHANAVKCFVEMFL